MIDLGHVRLRFVEAGEDFVFARGELECACTDGGGPTSPPEHKVGAEQLKKFALDVKRKAHSAYYFEKWPAVHKAFNDAATRAVTGDRKDIPKMLEEGAVAVHNAA